MTADKTAFSPPIPLTTLKACRHGRMLFLRRDNNIGRALELYGEYSEQEGKLLDDIVDPGEVIIEVGANIGTHTLRFARRVGTEGAVFAFEPQRIAFQLLCANVAFNEMFQVRTCHWVLGKQDGAMKAPSADDAGDGSPGAIEQQASGDGVDVPVRRLDDLPVPRVDLIKVDVEGMQADVLTGGKEAIHKFRPILYVKNDRRPRSEELIALIDELGYSMWWHLPPLFNPDNFAQNPNNVFGRTFSVKLLCFPKERSVKINGLRKVSGPKDWWDAKP